MSARRCGEFLRRVAFMMRVGSKQGSRRPRVLCPLPHLRGIFPPPATLQRKAESCDIKAEKGDQVEVHYLVRL